MKTTSLFLFCVAVLCSSASAKTASAPAITRGNTCAVHYDPSLPLDTSGCKGVLLKRPPTLAKCEIDFNNPAEPLMTYPWNAFLCGYNSQGWVWLVSIDKLSDTNYMVKVEYLENWCRDINGVLTCQSDTNVGDELMSGGIEATWDGPNSQTLDLLIGNTAGTVSNWETLEAWVQIIGEYQQ